MLKPVFRKKPGGMSDSVAASHVNLDLQGLSKDKKEGRRRALLAKSWVFAANMESLSSWRCSTLEQDSP